MATKSEARSRDKVDRQLLHEYMWANTDRRGMFNLRQGDLAKSLGIHVVRMSYILAEMCEKGMLKKYGTTRNAKYQVINPDILKWETQTEASCSDEQPEKAIATSAGPEATSQSSF